MRLLIAAIALGWACGVAHATDSAPILRFDGYGTIKFGMTVAEAERSLGVRSKGGYSESGSAECHYVSFGLYAHARFMIESGRITRADLDESAKNVLGLSVGMKLSDVRQRFPKVKILPHKYDDAGHYLIFASRSEKSEIVAEESNGSIAIIRGGLIPSVEYVEGCL
jgi:hypothetical protein